MEEGVASECYGSARAREMVVNSAVVAVFAVSTGVWESETLAARWQSARWSSGRMAWEAGESRFAVD